MRYKLYWCQKISVGYTAPFWRITFKTWKYVRDLPREAGEKVLIPINMRDGSVIAVGKGNPDWNYSAPHGAGRIMSRTKAKESLTMETYKEAMKGIYTTSVNENTIDEAPMAYKSLEDIIDVIQESVEVMEIMKPVYNFKASDEELPWKKKMEVQNGEIDHKQTT